MSTANDIQTNALCDKLKWTVFFILVAGVIFAHTYLSYMPEIAQPNLLIKILGTSLSLILAFIVALTTIKGKAFINFAKEARVEIRKVVWPTRKEANQTTLLIAVITIIAALILWGMDSVFIWVISQLTTLGH